MAAMTKRTRLVALVVAGSVAGCAYLALDPFAPNVEAQSSSSDTSEGGSVNTSEVLVETLVSSTEHNGNLGFVNPRALMARAPGTVTWLPEVGSVLRHGDTVWEIDRQPVIYIDGGVPMYRDLYNGVKAGDDVRQLEEFLISAGYGPDGWEADNSFNWTTRGAVKAFQKERDMTQSGLLGPAHIVVGRDDLRVSATAELGDDASTGPVITVTEVVAEVTLSTSARQLAIFQRTPAVLIVLADGREIPANLKEAKATPADEEGNFGYTISYVVGAEIGEAQPVKVKIEQVLASDALTVPVDALVALTEGGYAVEVSTESGLELRAVEVIDFDDTRVAITGDLDAGDRVVVP